MSMRVLIVDDEPLARARVRRLLEEVGGASVAGEAGSVPEARTLILAEKPELLLLDIRMHDSDGFALLESLPEPRPLVIFTTAFDHYAVRAFEVKSLDYLLKPVHKDRLREAVERARAEADRGAAAPPSDVLRLLEEIRAEASRPQSSAPKRIPAKRGAKILLLDPSEVIWFESEDELVYARTAEGRAMVERPLGELEEVLAGSFFRIHRSYLVNLSRVGAIVPEEGGTYRVVMKDEAHTPLPLSRRQAQKLREIIPW